MFSIVVKIRKLIAARGVVGTIKTALAFRYLKYFSPAQRRARKFARDRDLEFDRRWGVDTSGISVPGEVEVVGGHWLHGHAYQGADPDVLARALTELPIQHEHFTFVDFGSGKGRSVLVASGFPFRKVVGVEYSEHLNEIARRNLLRYPNECKKCMDIEIVCADAAGFPIPDGPLVLFFYNPFGKPVMSEVIRNVATSYRLNPRRVVVVNFYVALGDLWNSAGFVKEVQSSGHVVIYDTEARKANPPS